MRFMWLDVLMSACRRHVSVLDSHAVLNSHAYDAGRAQTALRRLVLSLYRACIYLCLGLSIPGLIACAPTEGDVSPTLPPDTSTPTPSPTAPPSIEDQDPLPSNPSPVSTVTQSDVGEWTMSPTGGPYSDMTGTLTLSDTLDSDTDPVCLLEYALTGYKVTPGCPGCNYTFRIKHVLLEGNPDDCLRTDMPEDEQYLILGYSSETRLIYYDYLDTGTWLPWYEGARVGDVISYEWIAIRGTEE